MTTIDENAPMSGAGELKPVAVKPLEWQTRTWDSDGYLCFAEASPCKFNYEIDRDGNEKKPFRVSRSCDINPFAWAETLEAAHAAAQAHFEARIRSALVSPDRALVDRVERITELDRIESMLAEGQGDDEGSPAILPEFEKGWSTYAKVEACLHLLERRRDALHSEKSDA